jgi:ankyrin repeat protein
VVKVLLEAGADANKALNTGGTPLQLAVHGGHLAVVEALLEAGADVKVMRDDGVTALSIAMHGGKAAIVAALQRHERSGRS